MRIPEQYQWIVRALGRATVYLIFAVAALGLLQHQGVIARHALTRHLVATCAVGWLLLAVWGLYRERSQ